jgi:hypothetical protein
LREVSPVRGEEQGKFRHITAQAGAKPPGQGEDPIDKLGKRVKKAAALHRKPCRNQRGKRRAGFLRGNRNR